MKASCFAAVSLLSINVYAWSQTVYIANTTDYLGGPTTKTVYPTAVVTPTSTFATTTSTPLVVDDTSIHVSVTITQLFLGPNPPIYSVTAFGMPDTPTPTTTATTTIGTQYYGPALLSNPASCTMTSFTYTTVHKMSIPPDLAAQATESINAAYVTSFGHVYSTDLGGQELHTLYSAVYFRTEALGGLLPVEGDEQHYLTECVDPRRYLCAKYDTFFPALVAATGGCPVPMTSVTYPPFMFPWKTASTTETAGATSGGKKANKGARTWDGPGALGGVVVLLAMLCVSL